MNSIIKNITSAIAFILIQCLILNNKIVKKFIGPLNQKSIDEIKLFIK